MTRPATSHQLSFASLDLQLV